MFNLKECRMKKIVLFFGSVLLLASCVSTNKGFQSSPVISRNVDLDPIKADIVVNEETKLKGESRSTYVFGLRVSRDNTFADGINYSTSPNANPFARLNFLKQGRLVRVRGAAAYNALKTGDYDVLVHPKYTITTKNFLIGKTYIVTIEGYGGTYTNFRTERQKVIITNQSKEYRFPDSE